MKFVEAELARRRVSSPLTGPKQVEPRYGIRSVLLSTIRAVPLIKNAQLGKADVEAVPLMVYGRSLPLI